MRVCYFCKAPTGIYLREHRIGLCPSCYPGWIEEQVAKTIKRFRMLEPSDRILLAVSGGKDSLSLWQILTRLGYETDALYICLGIEEESYSEISKEKCLTMAQKLNRPLHVVDLKTVSGYSMDEISRAYRKTCSACGAVKRYFMNKMTLEGNYTVIATGHNLDDEVSTLFGNLLRWDETYLNRQYPVNPPKAGLARKIKPMFYLSEKQAALYALTSGIDYIRQECPYSESATSLIYKENLNRLEQQNAGTLRFFLTNFINHRRKKIQENGFPQEEVSLNPCPSCGHLTVSALCKYCAILKRVRDYGQKKS